MPPECTIAVRSKPRTMIKTRHMDAVKKAKVDEEAKKVNFLLTPDESFRDWIARTKPRYRFYRHCEVLINVLQRVADGELKRVIVNVPPRFGKSETITRLFSAYFLAKYPQRWVCICSYGANLAEGLSRDSRDNYSRSGGKIKSDASAVSQWETGEGGGLFSAGVGGPILGKGWNCFPRDTLVATKYGPIAIGELFTLENLPKVWSYNHDPSVRAVEEKQIEAIARREVQSLILITFESGAKLRCTKEHQVYRVGCGYVEASKLRPKNRVYRIFGGDLVVDAIASIVPDGEEEVYDLQVEGNHNFFADGVLVHNCGILDDPLKNAEEADSETIRSKQQDWYDSSFMSREEPWTETDPTSPLIFVMQRWHLDDLVGWLLKLEEEADDDEKENWHIVHFEAIKSEAQITVPPGCTLEPDWREVGESLCPERRPIHKLLKIKGRLLKNGRHRFWHALYQQNPIAPDQVMVKPEWLQWFQLDHKPAKPIAIVQSWDTANKKQSANRNKTSKLAYSVCGTWFVTNTGYYLVDVWRDRVDSPELLQMAIALANKWRPNAVLIEDKASGTGLIQHIKSMSRINCVEVEVCGEGDKLQRFDNELPAIASGNVFIAEDAPWMVDYKTEILGAPNSDFFDQIDMTSQFLHWMRTDGKIKRGAQLL